MENPNVLADVVEVQEYPLLARRYMITGVPKTVINDRVQFVGAVPEGVFVDKLMGALGIRADEDTRSSLAVAPELGPSTRASPQG